MSLVNNILPLILKYSKAIETLNLDLFCHNCFTNLRKLNVCNHLLCQTCCETAINCPICSVPIKFIEQDELFENILWHIREINNIKSLTFETNIIPLFALETSLIKRDHRGETRLHKECRDGKYEQVKLLLNEGVDPSIQDFAGWTPLHEAVTSQKYEITNLLLNYGALINVPGLNYITPLHTAINHKNIPLIQLLVEHGADLSCRNKEGKKPLDFCQDHEILKTVCLTPTKSVIYQVFTIPSLKLFLSNVCEEDVKKLTQYPNVTVINESNFLNILDSTNYVVLGEENKPNKKHLQIAILQGALVVSCKWLHTAVFNGNAVNPLDYVPEIVGFDLKKAAQNVFYKKPKLFDGMEFYFHLNKKMCTINADDYTENELKILVKMGGGLIKLRRPVKTNKNNIVYPYHVDKKNVPSDGILCNLVYDDLKTLTNSSNTVGYICISVESLLNCVNTFSMFIN